MRSLVLVLSMLFAPLAVAAPKSLAVLPFDDLSPAASERWLERGMSAQIAWDLALSNELRVVPRARTHRLAERLRRETKATRWTDVAKMLAQRAHADWVVFGSFQREGERLALDAGFFDAASGAVTPLIEIRGPWRDLLRYQDEIAERALTVAGAAVTDVMRDRMAADPTPSLAAYEKFARAFAAWDAEENPRGALTEAAQLYREALRLDPRYYKALNNFGILLEHQRDFDAADRYYREALKLAPDEIAPRLNLANVALKRDRFDDALAECEAARRIDPKSSRSYLKKCAVYLRQNRYDLAEQECRAALRVDPDSAMALVNLGVVHFNLQRNEAAESAFRLALTLDNDEVASAYAHNNIGNVMRRRRRWDEALGEYLEALQWKDDYAVAAMNAGDAYLEKGDRAKAVYWYEEALRIDPELDAAKRKLENARK